MARQNIQFRGLRHSPSDITGQDGDLLECANLIHENGELKPIELPVQTTLQMGSGFVLEAVHNTVQAKLFVSVKVETVSGVTTSTLAAVNEAGVAQYFGDQEDTKEIEGEAVQWVETIGNTLIVGTDKSTHYALYKNGQYKWLGDKLPQPVFEFDFEDAEYSHIIDKGEPKFYGTIGGDVDVPGGGLPLWNANSTYDYPYRICFEQKENINRLAKWIKAIVALVESEADKNNEFLYPFFVRYALRMYDESYVQHSAPILLIPSTTNPLLACLNMYSFIDYHPGGSDEKQFFVAHPSVYALGAKMNYTFIGFVDETGSSVDVDDWEDIIKGVDIFVSSQVSSMDYDGLDRDYCIPDTFYNYVLGGAYPQPPYDIQDFGNCYINNSKVALYGVYDSHMNFAADRIIPYDDGYVSVKRYYDIPLPEIPLNKVKNKLQEVSLFYRVKRYSTNELASIKNIKKLFQNEVDSDTLTKLETLPTLPDDYISRCRIAGKANYNYNQRLLLGNIKLQAPLWYQDAKQFESENYNVDIIFKIDKPEKTIYVAWSWDDVGENDFGHYLYYPDPDCKEALISLPVSSPGSMVHIIKTFKIPMQEHTGLNGAYALMPALQSLYEAADGEEFEEYTDTPLPTPSTAEQRYYQQPNTIAMSSVANPFHFPATNFKDIGRTKVIGMAANTLDVSSGQWGQYPLYVFCSDGIIAVVIDGEGKFGGIQAVSADVLREPQSISRPTLVQTGQALMFLTQRGVMMIAGTKIECMSEVMNGRQFNLIGAKSDLLPINSILYNIGAFGDLITQTSDSTPFNEFAKTGFLAYDYAHNRVLLLNAYKYYQYVFSLKTGLWSKQIVYTNGEALQLPEQRGASMPTDLTLTKQMMKSTVNNYTEMYLQDAAGYLYRTMEVPEENDSKNYFQYGYLVSRPIRFGTDEYKTLTRLLHRFTHYNEYCFVKLALYGSRDGVKYGRINTLRGMSYQYFIFVVYTYLKPNERYSYLTVDFETRLTNKLR